MVVARVQSGPSKLPSVHSLLLLLLKLANFCIWRRRYNEPGGVWSLVVGRGQSGPGRLPSVLSSSIPSKTC